MAIVSYHYCGKMTEPDYLYLGWEVNVAVNFFVFDRIRDGYLAVQDIRPGSNADRIDLRFDKMKMEWSFIKFLSHDTLHDPSNGFLVDYHCIFGVEVFVIKRPGEGESLSFVKEPANGLQTWTINDFSKLNNSLHFSEVKLQLHPGGDSNASGTHRSLHLSVDDSETIQTRRKLLRAAAGPKACKGIRVKVRNENLEQALRYMDFGLCAGGLDSLLRNLSQAPDYPLQ
ncbi:unnamed protein product [Dovyalis caffra]|uniref:MATH domain-containing protein n=1 Tax=Dovyalis caffra TaxID=77055 RepID=A0AAV1RU98_9ROSI|nr:unnamed protein product [Dovyalis caffra]